VEALEKFQLTVGKRAKCDKTQTKRGKGGKNGKEKNKENSLKE